MGYKIEINWALKLKPEEGFPEKLELNQTYNFHKKETRIYPLDCNLQLINKDWEVFGEVQIQEYTLNGKETKGKFKVTKIYSDLERKVSTKLAKENADVLRKIGMVT